MFAAGAVFAGENGECAKKVGNKEGMAACHVSLASLNLTAEQKTKMEAAMKSHECSEAGEAKYMKQAESILNKEQLAKFKSESKTDAKEKTQS